MDNTFKCTEIGNQVWTDLLDIYIPGSVKIDSIHYYTWEQAVQAAREFSRLHGNEWRLPMKEDFITLTKSIEHNADKLVEFGFIKAGYYLDNETNGVDNRAYYWSSTCYDTDDAYAMNFCGDGVYLQYCYCKRYGFAVRCVKNLPPKCNKNEVIQNKMKVKIKKTGEIVNAAEYAKITLEHCDSYGNPIECSLDDIELLQESNNNIDWEQRRYDIAKEMMSVVYQESRKILLRGGYVGYNDVAQAAVELADMLIAELKKK